MTDLFRLSGLLFYIREQILQLAVVLAAIRAASLFYSRLTRSSISQVNGPPKSDWFFGNLTDIHFKDVGDPQIFWQKLYGSVFRIHGLFGEKYLMISDPKAIKHVLTNIDAFDSGGSVREMLKAMTGPGLIAADGDDHRRQRRVIQPAFGASQLKAVFPALIRHSQRLLFLLKKDIDAQDDGGVAKVDMYSYISKATLDTIGDAAFNHDFGALDDKQDSLRDAMSKTRTQSFECASKRAIFYHYIIEYLPSWMVYHLIHLPIKKFTNIRVMHDIATRFADKMVKEKLHIYQQGLEGTKDLMTLLVRANAAEKQESKLSDVEVNSEVITITLGGQGNNANTITFGLWELAKNVDMQRRIRQEILDIKQQTAELDDPDDYEKMPLLTAFIKELLRYHPVVYVTYRDAIQDAVIPLSKPIKLLSGQVVNELSVSKGQKIQINVPGYNRLPDLFGLDADDFNIERWLDPSRNNEKRSQGVGVYSNLITFGHGDRACIGWRFAVWEMKTIVADLLSNFEFSLPCDERTVRKAPALSMSPGVKGKRSVAPTMPLNVSILQQ